MNLSFFFLTKEYVKQYELLHGGNRNHHVRRFVNHLIKTRNLSGGALGRVRRGQGEKDSGRVRRGQGEKDKRPTCDIGLDNAYAASRALHNKTKQ
jgi:hypothetical protein